MTIDNRLCGVWSSDGSLGNMIDPSTGAIKGSVYNGEWYIFRNNGTFRYVIIGSGPIIGGEVIVEGNFIAHDGKIVFSDCKESWCPNPAKTGQKQAYKEKPIDQAPRTYYLECTEIMVLREGGYSQHFYKGPK